MVFFFISEFVVEWNTQTRPYPYHQITQYNFKLQNTLKMEPQNIVFIIYDWSVPSEVENASRNKQLVRELQF